MADPLERSLPMSTQLSNRAISGFLAFWLFVSTGALFPLLASGGRAHFDDDLSALLRLLLMPGVIIAPTLLWLKAREIGILLAQNPLLIILLLWVWTSVLWSIDPSISLRRTVILTTNSIITCYIIVSYQFNEILRTLFWICIIQLALSLIFSLLLTDLAYMPTDGRLRGIFTHKSVLGQCLVISFIVFILAYKEVIIPKTSVFIGFGLVVLLVVQTRSVTALFLICLLAILLLLIKTIRYDPVVAGSIFLFGLSFFGIVTIVIFLFFNELMILIGRDPTMTGRTEIWAYMLHYIQKRPMFGYGYRAFFENPLYGNYVKQTFLFDLTGSHNGYLEILLDLGIVGLVITLLLLLVGFFRAMRNFIKRGDLAAQFGLSWLVIYFARNMVESDLLSQSHLSWTLALFAVLWQSPAGIQQTPAMPGPMPQRESWAGGPAASSTPSGPSVRA